MPTQSERRAATRAKLVEAAQRLFVEQGYDDTATEAVLGAAGVSRGALYHHFPAKQDLFEAVFERVSRGAIDRAVARGAKAAGRDAGATERLIAGCIAWLREARDPAVAMILLDQGPKVLGWQRAREIENRSSLAVMKEALSQASAAGEIDSLSLDLTAGILNAALAEAALSGLYDENAAGPRQTEATIRRFIEGLRA